MPASTSDWRGSKSLRKPARSCNGSPCSSKTSAGNTTWEGGTLYLPKRVKTSPANPGPKKKLHHAATNDEQSPTTQPKKKKTQLRPQKKQTPSPRSKNRHLATVPTPEPEARVHDRSRKEQVTLPGGQRCRDDIIITQDLVGVPCIYAADLKELDFGWRSTIPSLLVQGVEIFSIALLVISENFAWTPFVHKHVQITLAAFRPLPTPIKAHIFKKTSNLIMPMQEAMKSPILATWAQAHPKQESETEKTKKGREKSPTLAVRKSKHVTEENKTGAPKGEVQAAEPAARAERNPKKTRTRAHNTNKCQALHKHLHVEVARKPVHGAQRGSWRRNTKRNANRAKSAPKNGKKDAPQWTNHRKLHWVCIYIYIYYSSSCLFIVGLHISIYTAQRVHGAK